MRLEDFVRLAKVWIHVPAHPRLVRGKVEHVDAYTYQREAGGRLKPGEGPGYWIDVKPRKYRGLGTGATLGPLAPDAIRKLERLELREQLRKKLVDYKPERPLEGGKSIREVIPEVSGVEDYVDLPFLDRLHEEMGVDPYDPDVTTEQYMEARNKLFAERGVDQEVPFKGLVVTQETVNPKKAEALIGKEFDPPPYVVRVGEVMYLLNGHHRAVAEKLAGKSSFRARVLDLSPAYVRRAAASAVDRLRDLVALAPTVKVRPYVRRKGGKYVPVVGYVRKGKPGIGGGSFGGGGSDPVQAFVGSEDERQRRLTLVQQRLARAIAQGLETVQDRDHDGEPDHLPAERAAIHDEILNDLWEREFAHVPSEGKAIISGGLGGAGKTTVLTQRMGLSKGQYGTVNPDDIKEELARRGLIPKVPGLTPMEASFLVHEESSYLAKRLAERAYQEKKNIIWDITMSSERSVRERLDAMEQAGYSQVHGVFVDIKTELSVQRALGRWWSGVLEARAGRNRIGGRFVPPEVIMESRGDGKWTRNRQVFEAFKSRFSSWELWDGNGPEHRRVAVSGKVSLSWAVSR